MNGWIDECKYNWMNEYKDGWMDGWMEEDD